MNTSEPKEPSFITILGRAFTIMEELLKSDKPLGVSELARLTGIPKANTFRIKSCQSQRRRLHSRK